MNKFILSLNCGSSSLKFNLFKIESNNTLTPYTQGIAEEIGNSESSSITYKIDDKKIVDKQKITTHGEALQIIFKKLVGYGISVEDICSVGHRVVHGGEQYSHSVKIDDNVIEVIRKLFPIAPLHNPPNFNGILEMKKLLPDVPQVAVFDTAYHASIPEHAFRYAIPQKWYKDFGVRKYGFHGTSHMYVSKRAARILNIPYDKFNCITAHLGNGSSVTKIQNGKSVDTSMGFTPLQGVIMGTRSGDIDPALISYVVEERIKHEGISKTEAYEEVMNALNKDSGLKALAGTNMMQLIREKALDGDEHADRIISIYAYRIAHYIGAYLATLPNTDAIVFTAGLGENEGYVRKRILEFLAKANFVVDDKMNNTRRKEAIIAKGDGTTVMVVPTNEEIVIGYDTLYLGYLDTELPNVYPFESQ